MKTYLQVFSGGFKNQIINLEELMEKIKFVAEKADVNGVIIGWALNKEFYAKLKKSLKKYNIELYFWLPVFSELDYFREFQDVINYRNENIKSTGFQEDENFNFYCPNDKNNIENIKSIFLEYLADYDIDGVFLDKIRYPSFSNNPESVFTCFCDTCKDKMKKSGINAAELQRKIEDIFSDSNSENKNPMGISDYKNFKFDFSDPIIDSFFKFKEESINDTLEELTDFFRSKNLKIGLDLFAPHIAYFTGQNIIKLSSMADFIKPMYYRATYAPAGIPFEIESYSKSFPNKDSENIKKEFFRFINESEEEISDKYMENELCQLKKEFDIKNICSGLEFNKIKDIALSDTDYLERSINSFYNSGTDGIVLSWDLMRMPLEHLDIYIKLWNENKL